MTEAKHAGAPLPTARSEASFAQLVSLARPWGYAAVLSLVSNAVYSLLNAVTPVVLQIMIDRSLPQRDARALAHDALLLGAILAFQLALLPFRASMVSRMTASLVQRLRTQILARVQGQTERDAALSSVPETLEVFSKHLSIIEGFFLVVVPRLLTAAIMGAPSLVLLFVIDWRLALISVFVAAPMTFGPMITSRRYQSLAAARQADERELADCLGDVLTQRRVVRAFGVEGYWQGRFAGLADAAAQREREANYWGQLTAYVGMGGTLVARAAVIVAGVYFALTGSLSMGSFIAFLTVLVSIVLSVNLLAESASSVLQASDSAARIAALLAAPASSDDEPSEAAPPLRQRLQLADVTFSYTQGRPALQGLSLTVGAGQRVALVGPSGSGKSTVLGLLLGFVRPQSGAVRWDGTDTRQFASASLRAHVGAVFQDAALFDISIRENIRLGKLDATDDEIVAAARDAELHDAVMAMPEGYETRVGPGGKHLSGGQRQRVAVARALVRAPAVLLLDEATSALDPQSEAALVATLRRLSRDRTVVSVTHRLETVRDYDLICVIKDGALVEQGSHEELLSRSEIYASMLQGQSGASPNAAGRAALDEAEAERGPSRGRPVEGGRALAVEADSLPAAGFTGIGLDASRRGWV